MGEDATPDRNPMMPDITGLRIVNIEMDPGDLLIFNSLLAHGVRPNHSGTRVRMAQYVAMYPADAANEDERRERIRLWREREHPRGGWPGDPRAWEKKHAEVAHLTPLGEKLLGLSRSDQT